MKKNEAGIPIDKFGVPLINKTFVKKVLAVVDKGLVFGLGKPLPGQMCVEAAVAFVFGYGHNDKPSCVDEVLSDIKIGLNDSHLWWVGKTGKKLSVKRSTQERSQGLRALAVAQLGSVGKFKAETFWGHVSDLITERAKPRIKQQLDDILKDFSKSKSARDMYSTLEKLHSVTDDFGDGMMGNLSLLPGLDEADNVPSLVAELLQSKSSATSETLHLVAEIYVEALRKMKMPGTRYLYLLKSKKRVRKTRRKK